MRYFAYDVSFPQDHLCPAGWLGSSERLFVSHSSCSSPLEPSYCAHQKEGNGKECAHQADFIAKLINRRGFCLTLK
ncbi:hypothetical protein LENED_004487 [Lentinula edodes]|uniref:Uncharacterized protein n=1 Tax=Lentinula edodes TaxID=5353 RepID=A0A1Q3E6F0_LENED|nr:hypothetical protein LENED_004487 [Lentinula edodes]